MNSPTPDQKTFDPLARYIGLVCAAIIVLLPFHAFLTVSLSSLFGHYTELRLWKEVVLVVLLVGAIIVGIRNRPEWSARRKLFGPTRLCTVAKLYGLLCVAAGLFAYAAGAVGLKSMAFGILLDLRFLLFFGIVWLVTTHGREFILRYWRSLLLVPAAVVVGFGLLQFAVLPPDFLSHFGYGPATIDAVQTIDQKDMYQRVQSTLRGANPLGAYLVLVIAAFGALLLASKPQYPGRYAAGFAATFVVLGLTFSRSAWIGAVIAVGWLLFQALQTARLRRYVMIATVAGLLAFSGVVFLLRDNDIFQNVFFHTDENSQSAESSNDGHLAATVDGLVDIIQHPLGQGTGTAGPASVYNDKQPPHVAENYFVQVGQETGLLGLGLFVTINVLLGRELWMRRRHVLAQALLASLLGISAINMFSHAWTDDTIAYIWWGLAGAAMALVVGSTSKTSAPKSADAKQKAAA